MIGLNEEEQIGACLDAVKHCVGSAVGKIIYVDSGSADRSMEIARNKGVEVIEIENTFRSPGFARNIGLEHVKTEYVLFLDGDMILDSDFIVSARTYFTDETIACVSGPIRERYPHKNIYHRGLCVDWTVKEEGTQVTPSGGGLFRVDHLRMVGGYNYEIPAGEEIDLKNRLVDINLKLVGISKVMAEHDLDMNSVRDLIARAGREGRLQAYALLHPENSSIARYKRLAVKNDIMVLFFIIALVVIVINNMWTVGGWILLAAVLAFIARFSREIYESHDPYGRLINFGFLYFKKPFQVWAQIFYLLKHKKA
ncbi:MAG: glycosyltransferase [Gammaproteobacteria bacterium]|nr:glycosyltransferase [Gammaproteobacteria bacterium]